MLNLAVLGTKKIWLGSEDSLLTVLDLQDKMLTAPHSVRKEAMAYQEELEENNEHFLLDITNNVAVINVSGHLVSGSEGYWGAYWGVVGYQDIRSAIVTARIAGVDEIIFDYDTGGGAFNGIGELADFIKSQDILTTSYTGGVAASGGVWLATASDKFYASRLAEIGSIGVLAVTTEITEMLKAEGVAVRVFKSTPLKATGNRYEKLSAEGAAEIQKNLQDTHKFFVDEIAVNQNIPNQFVEESIAIGKMWFAEEASQLNLIDDVKSFEEVFVAITDKYGNNEENEFNFKNVEGNMSKRKVLDAQAAAAIASGVPVDTVLETAAEKEKTGNGLAAEKVAAAAAAEEKEKQLSEKVAAEEKEKQLASDEGSDDAMLSTKLFSQVAALQDEKVDLKVKIAQLEATAVSYDGLKKATAVAVQKAHVAIGSPPPTMDGLMALDASALLQQHTLVQGQLETRYPTGQVTETAEEPEDENLNAAAKVANDALLKMAKI